MFLKSLVDTFVQWGYHACTFLGGIMTTNVVYLDNQASTPVDPEVVDAMLPYFYQHPANPHSGGHVPGQESRAAVTSAAQVLAGALGASPEEFVFTSGATESNNLAIFGLAAGAPPARRRILLSAVEHPSVLAAAREAGARFGLEVGVVPVNSQGLLCLKALQSTLAEDVLLVSVLAVDNIIGTVQPVAEIAALCHRVGALVHSDATQALPALDLNLGGLGVDLLSLSGHKIYGPKGIGALFVRKGLEGRIKPLMFGGGQQRGLRPGTIPVPLCVGLAKAVTRLSGSEARQERAGIAVRRAALVEGLQALSPEIRLVGGPYSRRHPGNAAVMFPGRSARKLMEALAARVAVSTGSACSSAAQLPSHVFTAIGLSREDADSCLRLSLGRFNDDNDIQATLAAFREALSP
jgi:cysteine desulfurase